ncbi:MAG TPA: oligopeptide/dipeptide ABC transporter ATP-binding protein [Acidimicrobiales bacterium]
MSSVPETAVNTEVILQLDNVVKYFDAGSRGLAKGHRQLRAVDGVTLEIRRGETLGLVGESGSGKSTLARCIVRLQRLTSGRVVLDGVDISKLSRRDVRPLRTKMQLIFQDPFGSLNPRRRVGSIIAEPLVVNRRGKGLDLQQQVQELMRQVGLNPEHYNRFPAQFSGGQRQRVGVARALALRPELIICDEPVSALDISIQAQIINLLVDLQNEFRLTYLFIAHDLTIVRHVSDRIAVMYLGKIVELADSEQLFERPRHPYTAALLSASPTPDPDALRTRRRIALTGDVPSPLDLPSGCRFRTRCPRAQDLCASEEPSLEPRLGDDASHPAACHFPLGDGEIAQAETP